MDAQDFRSLQEAYMEVVENQQLDEAEGSYGQTPKSSLRYGDRWQKDLKTYKTTKAGSYSGKRLVHKNDPDAGNFGKRSTPQVGSSAGDPRRTHFRSRIGMTPSDREEMRGEIPTKPGGMPKGKKLARQKASGVSAESFDIYDIILSHLLDEGYAETVESAQAIMVNMSEEWRDEIVEEMLDEANKAEKMLGLTPRQREQARNLHQYTGKPIFYGTNPNRRKKPDRSDPILNKSHKDMTAKRQASHKAGRHLRGDTGESGNVVRSRYQANKDHKDGYPSIKRVDT